MKCNIKIDDTLYQTYPEIRLGLLQFKANVKESDNQFWDYMHNEIQPKIKNDIEDKEWKDIPGVKGSRAAYKAFGRNPGRYRYLLKHYYEEFVVVMNCITSTL